MNSIEKLLSEYFDVEVDTTSSVLDYIFRISTFEQLKVCLNKHAKLKPGKRMNHFRCALVENGYLFKNLKMWIFYIHKKGIQRIGPELLDRFGILEQDIYLLSALSSKAKSGIRRMAKQYKALSLNAMDRAICHISNNIQTWIRKFVFRKLRFIAESQGMELADLEGELISKGVQSLFMVYPRVENMLHATNIVKRVIHNHGMNLISCFTHQKRARLIQHSDGTFSNVNENVESMDLCAGEIDKDLRIDICRVLESLPAKGRTLVGMVCGLSKKFSIYLQERSIRTEADDLLRKNQWRFLKHAAGFLRISINDAVRHFREVQFRLSAYAS